MWIIFTSYQLVVCSWPIGLVEHESPKFSCLFKKHVNGQVPIPTHKTRDEIGTDTQA